METGWSIGRPEIDLLPLFLVIHREVSRRSQIVVACAFNGVTEEKCKTRSRVSSDS